jgi:hypothetical protein
VIAGFTVAIGIKVFSKIRVGVKQCLGLGGREVITIEDLRSSTSGGNGRQETEQEKQNNAQA